MAPITVLGAGGHAKSVISAAQAAGLEVDRVCDDDPSRIGQGLGGVPISGTVDSVPDQPETLAVIAVGGNFNRKRISDRFMRITWASVIHPAAVVDRRAVIEAGAVVLAGAIVQPYSRIDRHAIVNTGAIVDHDCRIDRFAHLAPGSVLAGDVRIGEGVLVGVGSSILPGLRVGEWATVGAGAVVTRDVPPHSIVMGVPAKSKG